MKVATKNQKLSSLARDSPSPSIGHFVISVLGRYGYVATIFTRTIRWKVYKFNSWNKYILSDDLPTSIWFLPPDPRFSDNKIKWYYDSNQNKKTRYYGYSARICRRYHRRFGFWNKSICQIICLDGLFNEYSSSSSPIRRSFSRSSCSNCCNSNSSRSNNSSSNSSSSNTDNSSSSSSSCSNISSGSGIRSKAYINRNKNYGRKIRS